MILPVEIWEQIFLRSDPVTLMKMKTVCTTWRDVIERVLQNNNHWYKKCKQGLSKDTQSALFGKLYPSMPNNQLQLANHNSDMWVRMYRLWTRCRTLVKSTPVVECLQLLSTEYVDEYITCMTSSGDTLALGTSEGYIYFYKLNGTNEQLLYKADHLEYVCDVKFLRSEEKLLAISVSINNHMKVWNIKSKKCLLQSRAKLICTSYSFSYATFCNILVVDGSVPRQLYELHDLDDIVAVAADNDKVSLYSEAGYYVVLNLNLYSTSTVAEETCTKTFVQPPQCNIRRYYIFQGEIASCITEHGLLGLSVECGEWKLYNIFRFFSAVPTAVLIYNSLLILGLDTGNVLVFGVENFEMLDFNSDHYREIKLDKTPIVSLEIMTHYGECLLAASQKNVYIVRFI